MQNSDRAHETLRAMAQPGHTIDMLITAFDEVDDLTETPVRRILNLIRDHIANNLAGLALKAGRMDQIHANAGELAKPIENPAQLLTEFQRATQTCTQLNLPTRWAIVSNDLSRQIYTLTRGPKDRIYIWSTGHNTLQIMLPVTQATQALEPSLMALLVRYFPQRTTTSAIDQDVLLVSSYRPSNHLPGVIENDPPVPTPGATPIQDVLTATITQVRQHFPDTAIISYSR